MITNSSIASLASPRRTRKKKKRKTNLFNKKNKNVNKKWICIQKFSNQWTGALYIYGKKNLLETNTVSAEDTTIVRPYIY